MTKDLIIRQYAHANVYIDPIINNPGEATGLHMLVLGGVVTEEELANYIELSDRAKLAGLDVIPGCRMVPIGDYDNPLVWTQAAAIVRQLGPHASRGLFTFDGENYFSGQESRVPLPEIRILQEPLVEALNELNLKAGWYPGSLQDTSMVALLEAVGGEAWVEGTFGSSVRYVHDHYAYENEIIHKCEVTEQIKEALPGVTIRYGYYDRAIRSGLLHENRKFELPKNSWVFDRTRATSIIPGVGNERKIWGSPEWLTGESLSTLNNGVQNVFQIQPNDQDPNPKDVKGDEGQLRLLWKRSAAKNGKNDPIQTRSHPSGYEFRGKWHAEARELTNLDQATIFFEMILPEDISGSFPLASAWWEHGCCRAWDVHVAEGKIKLSFGMGTRGLQGAAGYTFEQVMELEYSDALAGERTKIVFGYDANTIYLPGREPITLPDGLETNNIRSSISLGYANKIMAGTSERTHWAREGTIWTNQLVRWNRILTQEEMTEVLAGGRFPWGF